MKALIVADLHYNLRQFDWLLRVAGDYDLVIVAGDLLDLAGHADLDTQIVVVTKYMARLARMTRLVVCSGNHDTDERSPANEPLFGWFRDLRADGTHADGEHVPLPGGLISICPWSDGSADESILERFLAGAARPTVGPWIWIHHVPPSGSPVAWNGHGHGGDDLLQAMIARLQPDLVVCGHIHEAPFRRGGSWVDRLGRTWVVNPGRQLGELPAMIEFDLCTGRLIWNSLAGSDEAWIGEAAAA
jgi:Icc-related predicted phosphoesterase